MNSSGEQPARLGFWALLLLGIFAWAPATYPGYWQSLEGFVPVFNVTQNNAIASVATQPDLWRGTGNAGFILAQPFLFLGFSPVEAVRATFILALILGGLGVYAWLRPFYGDRGAGLAGLVYTFLPAVLATVYVRGSVSDAMILALLPLTLATTAAYATGRSPAVAALMLIGVVWMWRTQAGLALVASLLLVAYALYVERDWMATLVVAASALIGLASLIPLWATQASSPVLFSDHFVYPFQLFGHRWAVRPSEAGWQDGYPFQIGLAAVIFGIVAIWLRVHTRGDVQSSQSPNQPWTRLFAFSVVGSLLFVLLSLTVSAPLWQITGAGRLFTYPWQIMLAAAPLLAASAGALPVLNTSLARAPYWAVLAALTILASYSYLTSDFTQATAGPTPYAIIGPDNNFMILDAQLTKNEDSSTAEATITWQTLQPLPFDYNVFFQALLHEDGTERVIAQSDTQPLGGVRPATSWRQGEVLQDAYTIDLSQVDPAVNLNEADIRYYFGYYDWRDGTRLPVHSRYDSGQSGETDDKLVFYGR